MGSIGPRTFQSGHRGRRHCTWGWSKLRALSAFINDETTGPERAETAMRIARDPASAAVVAAYRAQDNALRALFAGTADRKVQVIVVRPRPSYLMATSWLGGDCVRVPHAHAVAGAQ
jgi:hypothetical protein